MSVGGEKTGISESPNCALVGKGVELVKNEFSSWRQIMRNVVVLYYFLVSESRNTVNDKTINCLRIEINKMATKR